VATAASLSNIRNNIFATGSARHIGIKNKMEILSEEMTDNRRNGILGI